MEIIDPNITDGPHIWHDDEGSPEGSVTMLLDFVPFAGCSVGDARRLAT